MLCDRHGVALPCPWPHCRVAAGIEGLIHEGQQARHFVCCRALLAALKKLEPVALAALLDDGDEHAAD